jgi:glycosyltransferase involved in cell wall biosynthesis
VISVIVPVYNGAHVVPRTLPAMLAQEEPAEWLFVDDGSTDDTGEVLAGLVSNGADASGATCRVLSHPANRGRAAARNTGLDAAHGALLLFLDADVAPAPGYLTAMRRSLERQGVVGAVGRLAYTDVDAADPYHRYLRSSRRGVRGHDPAAPLPWRNFLLGVGGVRAEAARAVGPFDAALSYGEDLEYACRLGRRYPDGLRWVPEAVGLLHDLGTLDTALAKMAEFGEANLPALVARYPELEGRIGVDVVRGGAGARGAAQRALLRPGLAHAVRAVLPHLPPGLSDFAVRYLLGFTLAESYGRGLRSGRSG